MPNISVKLKYLLICSTIVTNSILSFLDFIPLMRCNESNELDESVVIAEIAITTQHGALANKQHK